MDLLTVAGTADEGTSTAADWALYSDEPSGAGASLTDPWQLRSEITQQSGSEEELGRVVSVLIGQQACV